MLGVPLIELTASVYVHPAGYVMFGNGDGATVILIGWRVKKMREESLL